MKNIIPTVLLLVLVYPASGQVYSLADCFNLAIAHNFELRKASIQEENLLLDLTQVKNEILPNLNIGSSIYTSGNAVDPTNNSFASSAFLGQRYYLGTDYKIWDWGKRKLNRDIASNAIESSTYYREMLIRDIKKQVVTSYATILSYEKSLEILELEKEESARNIEITAQLITKGYKSKKDLLELETQELDELLRSKEIELQLSRSKNDLSNLLGLNKDNSSDRDFKLVDILTGKEINIDHNKIATLVKNHPAILRENEVAKLNMLKTQLDRKRNLPDLNLSINAGTNYSSRATQLSGISSQVVYNDYILNGENISLGQEQSSPSFTSKTYASQFKENLFYSFSLGISYPIFDRSVSKLQIKKSVLESKLQDVIIDEKEDELTLLYENSILELTKLEEIIRVQEQLNKKEDELYQMKTREYQLGKLGGYEWTLLKQELQRKKMKIISLKLELYFKYRSLEFL